MNRRTPAMIVAAIALVFAVAGTAIAGPDVVARAITKQKIKKIAKKQANKVLNQREAGLNVNSAKTADRATTATTADSATTATTADSAGTGRSTFKDGVTQITAPSAGTVVLSLAVPEGSYLFIAKGVLAKAGSTLITCTTTAGVDTDTSLAHIDASANNTIVNTVAHTFNAAGTAEFKCDNPSGNPLFVTNAKLTAIPFASLENTAAP